MCRLLEQRSERSSDRGRMGSRLRSIPPLMVSAIAMLAACSQPSDPQPDSVARTGAALSALAVDKRSPIFGLKPNAKPLRLVVKFQEGSEVRMLGGRLSAAAGAATLAPELRSIETELAGRGMTLG